MSLRFIINPLLQIREAMQRLPDTMQPIDAPNLLHPNEVGYLTYSFNQMVEKLRTASDSLVIAKQQAEAANIAKSDFLSQMSHELRTPMHAILNYSNIGLKSIGMEDTSRLTKSLTNINTAGMRLLAMINDLLDLSKLEAGKMQINLAPVDVMSLLHKTLEELDALLKPKALSVVVKDELLRKNVMADADRLVQVLVNLLSNAIRYSAEHGTITIILNNTPVLGKEGFVLSVENNGTLIPEEDLKMIFERFIQSASARSMAGTTGLGLAICREILQAHQGEIWAENIQPNTVRFSLFIPEENDACAIV
jgi:signal transduction histidine kinase